MALYILRRVLIWIPSLLLILLGVYALAYFGAGDPIRLMFMREPGSIAYNPERIEAVRVAAGLDRPFLAQFLSYVGNLLHGDMGNSLVTGQPVARTIAAAAPVSLQLGLITIALTAAVAIPLGLIAALRQNSLLDYIIQAAAQLLWAIPAYVVGPLLMVAIIVLMPSGNVPYGWGGIFDVRIILPLLVLSMQPIALIARQTRAAVVEVMNDDYVRTARAKGVPELHVVLRHILRPVLTPVITQLGLIMITMVNGAIFVELVFGLPGLGRLTVQSTLVNDYPIILAIALIGAVLVMASNLLVDVLYPLLDPRAAQARTER